MGIGDRTRSGWRVMLAGVLSLALVGPLHGQSANGGMTPHDVARIRTVSNAVVSPDGERVAFLVSVPRNPLEETRGADCTCWTRPPAHPVNTWAETGA